MKVIAHKPQWYADRVIEPHIMNGKELVERLVTSESTNSRGTLEVLEEKINGTIEFMGALLEMLVDGKKLDRNALIEYIKAHTDFERVIIKLDT